MSENNGLSFLPDDYVERRAQRRTNVICGLLFAVVLMALGAAFTLTERPLSAARRANAEVAVAYAEAAKPIEQFRQMQEKQKEVSAQAELSASLLERVPRSFLLAEVANALPRGVSLLEFSLDSKARPVVAAATGAPAGKKTQFELKKEALAAKNAPPPLPQPVLLDVTVRVTGLAGTDVQVAKFMSRLSRSPLLRDVNLLISDEFQHDKETVRKFEIEMQVNPDADVEQLRMGAADGEAR